MTSPSWRLASLVLGSLVGFLALVVPPLLVAPVPDSARSHPVRLVSSAIDHIVFDVTAPLLVILGFALVAIGRLNWLSAGLLPLSLSLGIASIGVLLVPESRLDWPSLFGTLAVLACPSLVGARLAAMLIAQRRRARSWAERFSSRE